jgi:hypothetical protein
VRHFRLGAIAKKATPIRPGLLFAQGTLVKLNLAAFDWHWLNFFPGLFRIFLNILLASGPKG